MIQAKRLLFPASTDGSTLFIAKKRLPDNSYWRAALGQKVVMELFQAEAVAAGLLVIIAQGENLHLAKRIDKICRIHSTAPGFTFCVCSLLITLLDEKLGGILKAHIPGVHLDADYVAACSQERVVKLDQLQGGVARAEPLLRHHFFAIMSPAFGVGITAEQLSCL